MLSKDNANKLRKLQTPEEQLLWKRLKDRRLANYKFRRQVTIDSLIVDFCCFEKRLVIELDGHPHLANKLNDQIRDQYLQSQGFKVIRIWNGELKNNFEKMLNKIIKTLESPSSVLPRLHETHKRGSPPSPVKGEGKYEV